MKHLELFAGIGGFRRALDLIQTDMNVTMECVGYSEIDEKAKKTYCANFHLSPTEVDMGDIVAFNSDKDNIRKLPDFDLLTGGFPCQSFSMMGKQAGFEDQDRGQMFFRILEILEIKRPKYILLENVKNLYSHDKGNTFKVIKSELEKLEYKVYSDIFNTNDFHLAQIRNRVYIFGTTEKDKTFDFNAKIIAKHFDTVYKQRSVEKQSSVIDVLQVDVDTKYYLSDRIKPTILSDGSGKFKSKSDINRSPARPLTATMHKMHRACQDNYYSTNFIKTHGKENPAETLSKEDLCKLPIRKLTPQEAMMLQGFPPQWSLNAQLVGLSDGALYKQAGNAVSVNVPYAIISYCISNNIIEE
jgi:DNA (cytosine-5)-methyltransferase 1